MTILEQRFLESVPSYLKKLEVELGQLNGNLSRLIECLDELDEEQVSGVFRDNIPLCNHSIAEPNGAAKLLKMDLQHLDHEEVWILLLNQDMRPMKKERINVGNLSSTIVDVRRIVKLALDNTASSVILFHNHPSGNPVPSEADIKQTEDIRDSLKLFAIGLTDHIIVGGDGETYYSFAEGKVQSLKKQ